MLLKNNVAPEKVVLAGLYSSIDNEDIMYYNFGRAIKEVYELLTIFGYQMSDAEIEYLKSHNIKIRDNSN